MRRLLRHLLGVQSYTPEQIEQGIRDELRRVSSSNLTHSCPHCPDVEWDRTRTARRLRDLVMKGEREESKAS
ncbi:MAG: hypothetical protein E6J42_11005 [Chloroflexi bacterium]|nr:MAG: hypothetical protein E6J42_11005 [Chloroflexota bacterium]